MATEQGFSPGLEAPRGGALARGRGSPARDQPSPHRHRNQQDLGHYSRHAGEVPLAATQREMSAGLPRVRVLLSPPVPAGPRREVPDAGTCLLPQGVVFRRERPPQEGSSPSGRPARSTLGKRGLSERNNRACPRGPCHGTWVSPAVSSAPAHPAGRPWPAGTTTTSGGRSATREETTGPLPRETRNAPRT